MLLSDMNTDCCCYIYCDSFDRNPWQTYMNACNGDVEGSQRSTAINHSIHHFASSDPLYLSGVFNQVLSGLHETQAKSSKEEQAKKGMVSMYLSLP